MQYCGKQQKTNQTASQKNEDIKFLSLLTLSVIWRVMNVISSKFATKSIKCQTCSHMHYFVKYCVKKTT